VEVVVDVELELRLLLHAIDLQCLDLDHHQLPGRKYEQLLEEFDLDFYFVEFSWDVRNFWGPEIPTISPELPENPQDLYLATLFHLPPLVLSFPEASLHLWLIY